MVSELSVVGGGDASRECDRTGEDCSDGAAELVVRTIMDSGTDIELFDEDRVLAGMRELVRPREMNIDGVEDEATHSLGLFSMLVCTGSDEEDGA